MKKIIWLLSALSIVSACQSQVKKKPLCSKMSKVPAQGCLDDTHFEPGLDDGETLDESYKPNSH